MTSFAELGVVAVVDLRSWSEIVAPSSNGRLFRDVEHYCVLSSDETERLGADYPRVTDYADWYERLLKSCAQGFIKALVKVAELLPRKAVLCCAQGKDRTGLVGAAVLEAVGAPRDLILADYAKSARELAKFPEALRPYWERRRVSPSGYLARYAQGARPLRQLYGRLPESASPMLCQIAAVSDMPEFPLFYTKLLEPYSAAKCG